MKMFIKSSLAVVIASSALIACIDNTVSPEVQQARAAQVNYLNAVTAYQTALADNEKAQADYQVLLNANQSTANSVAAANAEASIKQAEINLATATQNLAAYLASHKMDVANTYVNGYNNATAQISTLLSQKAAKASDLAYAQQLIDDGSDISFDLLKEEYQRNLDNANAELEFLKAGLTALEAVQSTPTKEEAQAQLNDVNAQLLALQNAYEDLNVKYSAAQNTYNEANTKVNNAQQAINNNDSWTSQLASVNSDITSQTTYLAQQQAYLNTYKATLTAKTTILTSSKAALAPKLTTYNTDLATRDSKQNLLDIANANVVIAQNNFNADPTPANQTKLDDANTAASTAQTALNDAQTALNDAQTALNDAQNQVNNAQNDVDNAQNDVDDQSSYVQSQQTYLSDLTVSKADFEAKIAANQAAYDDAEANLEAYKIARDAANRTFNDINDQYDSNDDAQSNLYNIRSSLQDYISTGSGIGAAIEDQKDEIASAKEDVDQAAQALADNDINKAEAEAMIENLQEDLDVINAKIDAQTAIAAKFKALLTTELGS